MRKLNITTKHFLLSVALGLSFGTFAAGINWQYTGTKPYDKAVVIWTDDRYVGKIRPLDPLSDFYDAKVAVETVRTKIMEALKGENPIYLKDIIPLATANYNCGTVLATEASPSAAIQRIHHDNLYIAPKDGWGFSLFLNLDSEGRITEFATNDIGSGEIDSDTIFSARITIGNDELTTIGVTEVGKEAFKPKLSAIDLKLSDPNIRNRSIEPNLTIVSIDNAVQGHSYQVIDTKDLSSPFIKNELVGIKKADADGLLTFEVPLDPSDKVHFYKIELIE